MQMKQISLATTGFELVIKRTRKREFLDEMNLVIPWPQLLVLITPHAPAGKTGRPLFVTDSSLQNTCNPHERWLCGVNPDGQNSQIDIQWSLFSGSF
jgi:hypothetical protein